MRQRSGGCIFCGGGPLTKEHAWPRWLRRLVPPAGTGTYRATASARGLMVHDRSWNASEPTALTVKAVCGGAGGCNDGWMSVLEMQTLPILSPLIEGKTMALTLGQQRIITTWATKTAMVFECLHPKSMRFTRGDRRQFYGTRSPPIGMIIELAAFQGPWQLNFHHLVGETTDHPDGTFSASAFTFVMGPLLLRVLYDPAPRPLGRPSLGAPTQFTTMVWPPAVSPSWPPKAAIAEHELPQFTRSLFLQIVEDLDPAP